MARTQDNRQNQPITAADLERVYQRAVEYLNKGGYGYAGKLFRQIEAVQPGYMDAAALIRICDEGKRAQTFVQWSAASFTLIVFIILWIVWRQTDFWTLVICGIALVVGIGLAQQIYARFLAPRPGQNQ
ncbi:MAG: hypothetical protein IPM84_21210 [Anaerolineae bacterium]|nr:hypothetical protein [Anaerolineae bacterium]